MTTRLCPSPPDMARGSMLKSDTGWTSPLGPKFAQSHAVMQHPSFRESEVDVKKVFSGHLLWRNEGHAVDILLELGFALCPQQRSRTQGFAV